MKQFVTFDVQGQLFGIEILYVRELNQISEITDVELAPDYITGLINLRGQVVTIFDIGKRLGYDARESGCDTYNIILKTESELSLVRAQEGRDDLKTSEDVAGLLVNAFGDVVEVQDNQIQPPPANISERQKQFMTGVVKNETALFTVLDVSNLLLTDDELGRDAVRISA